MRQLLVRAGRSVAICSFGRRGVCLSGQSEGARQDRAHGRVGGRRLVPRGNADRFRVPPAATSIRACGSPAHGSPTSFTAGLRLGPPVPEGAGRDDGSVEVDQAHVVGGPVMDDRPAEPRRPFVAPSDKAGEALERTGADLGEVPAGVLVAEVTCPTAQKPIELVHAHFERVAEPLAVRDFANPRAGPLHRLS